MGYKIITFVSEKVGGMLPCTKQHRKDKRQEYVTIGDYKSALQEAQKEIEKAKNTLKEILKLNNWFTAHLLSQYSKIESTDKEHIDQLYLEFNRRWKGTVSELVKLCRTKGIMK